MSDCKHKWIFGGVRWHHGHQLPGSGARAMMYEDWFYCEHCTISKHTNVRQLGNSYGSVLEGSMPK